MIRRFLQDPRAGAGRWLALAAAATLTVACATASIPPPGSAAEQREIEQGREADEVIRAQFGVYEDAELQAYVTRVGGRLAAVSERPGLPWTFRVLDSPVVNAFAIPGGFVYLTRGVLAHMNSEAEMAGVLGHEIGHITGRHSAAQQRRSTFATLGILLGAVLAPDVAGPLLQTGIAQTAVGLLLLRYSRSQELDADERGIGYTTTAGYDPRGIGEFFHTLQTLEQQSDRKQVPGWASTHPEVEDRIERTDELAAETLQARGLSADQLTVGRTDHLLSVDGIVFGENPREGFMEGDDFLHPDLRFALTYPRDWQVNNGRQAVIALSPREDAIIQLTIPSLPEGTSAEAYVRDTLRSADATILDSGRTRVNGLDAVQARFRVASQDQTYEMFGLWISYRDNLYELLGITSPARMSTYLSTFRSSLGSFRELHDAAALAVQPARLEVRRIDRSVRLADLLRQVPVSVEPSTIALINQLELSQTVEAGTLLKLVLGGPTADRGAGS